MDSAAGGDLKSLEAAFVKIAKRFTNSACEIRSITEASIGSSRTSEVSVRPKSISVRR